MKIAVTSAHMRQPSVATFAWDFNLTRNFSISHPIAKRRSDPGAAPALLQDPFFTEFGHTMYFAGAKKSLIEILLSQIPFLEEHAGEDIFARQLDDVVCVPGTQEILRGAVVRGDC